MSVFVSHIDICATKCFSNSFPFSSMLFHKGDQMLCFFRCPLASIVIRIESASTEVVTTLNRSRRQTFRDLSPCSKGFLWRFLRNKFHESFISEVFFERVFAERFFQKRYFFISKFPGLSVLIWILLPRAAFFACLCWLRIHCIFKFLLFSQTRFNLELLIPIQIELHTLLLSSLFIIKN